MSEREGNPRTSVEERVAMSHRSAVVIVLAMSLSIVLYLVVGLVILGRGIYPGRGSDLRTPLYGAVAVLALGALALRRVLLLKHRLESVAQHGGVIGVVKYLLTVTVISAVLAEAAGIAGLMMIFFGGDRADLIRVSIVALVVSLYNYPRLGLWRQLVEYFAATRPAPLEPQ
ncbi:MAG TPA: hypothetical protein VKM94_05015 [Blastocatellia bacterium]|nr:hypothetical protein [Blastocatellia bacterium]